MVSRISSSPDALRRSSTFHNEEMKHRAAHYNVYLDELTRRETVRQGARMEALTTSLKRLTWWIVVLTVIIVIATVVGVLLTALTLTLGG